MRRRWFTVWIDGRESKWAHAFAIEWTAPDDGSATPPCGIKPFEHGSFVRFLPCEDVARRCRDCAAKMEEGQEQAA